MTIRNQTQNVGPLSLRADVGSVDEKARTVEMTWSTGARVYRSSWFDAGSFEELSMDPAHVRMDRMRSGNAPFLADHYGSTSNVLGVIESARLEGGKGTAKVRFPSAGTDANADQVFEKIRQGILKNVSVGYRVHRAEKVGRAARSEGGDELPVYRVTDWEPHEVSAVAIPADASATFRSESTQHNPCVFVTREEEQNVDEEQKKREAEALAKRQAEEQAALLKAAEERGAKAERDRAEAKATRDAGIRSACKVAKLDEKFAETLLGDANVDVPKAREMIFEELAKRSDDTAIVSQRGSGIEQGETSREKWLKGAEAGQLNRAGAMIVLSAAIASTKRKVEQFGNGYAPGLQHALGTINEKETGGEFRGMSLVETARDFLATRGVKTRGMSPEALLTRAMNYRDSGSEQTTSDFGTLLENIMYKTLLGFYAQADDTWRRWSGVDSVEDFRPANRYRLGSFGVLDLMGENDEYKHKKIPDGFKQQISVLTYGNKISLSRRAMINDDMNAVMTMAQQFGRSAGLSLEVLAYAQLALNTGLGPNVTYNGITAPLMDDQFANINDTGSALSVVGLEADRVQMAKQKDPSNNEILAMRPDVLLLPIGLEGEAKVINRSTTDPTITAGNPTNRPNISVGLFSDIVGTSRITGTRRYLLSRNQGVDAFKMVFLNGSQVPMMEQRPGWDVDGIEWKLRHDFNFLPFDPKAIATNAGA